MSVSVRSMAPVCLCVRLLVSTTTTLAVSTLYADAGAGAGLRVDAQFKSQLPPCHGNVDEWGNRQAGLAGVIRLGQYDQRANTNSTRLAIADKCTLFFSILDSHFNSNSVILILQ